MGSNNCTWNVHWLVGLLKKQVGTSPWSQFFFVHIYIGSRNWGQVSRFIQQVPLPADSSNWPTELFPNPEYFSAQKPHGFNLIHSWLHNQVWIFFSFHSIQSWYSVSFIFLKLSSPQPIHFACWLWGLQKVSIVLWWIFCSLENISLLLQCSFCFISCCNFLREDSQTVKSLKPAWLRISLVTLIFDAPIFQLGIISLQILRCFSFHYSLGFSY